MQKEIVVHSAKPLEIRFAQHHERTADDGYPGRLKNGRFIHEVQALEIGMIGKQAVETRCLYECPPRSHEIPAAAPLFSSGRVLEPAPHQPSLGPASEHTAHACKSAGRQVAIGIYERKQVSARRRGAKVTARGKTDVFAGIDQADAAVLLRSPRQSRAHVVSGAIDNDDQLPQLGLVKH